MYADDEGEEYLQRDDRVFDEKLDRIGGVFVEPEQTQVDCNQEEDACAPDDYPEDPYAIDNRPGTEDDIGYSLGLQSRDANDLTLVPEGGTRQMAPRAPDTERDLDLGTEDEQDLWSRHEPLVEEDVEDGVMMPLGVSEEDAAKVAEAMGDEASEVNPEAGGGSSATAEPNTGLDHGGFPERED